MIAEPSAFETIVRERSWDWLVELQRRLGVELQLVGVTLAPLLPHGLGGADALSTLISQPESPLHPALAATFRSRKPQALTVDGVQVVCGPLGAGRRAPGVLVVSRGASEAPDHADRVRERLELIASWLTTAIEAHVESPPGMQASGLDRVSPLCRLLAHDGGAQSDRELVRRFGEALAIWFDVDAFGYVETARGTFARDVSLPGVESGRPPGVLPGLDLSDGPTLTRLPAAHAERFGFSQNSPAFVTRIHQHDGPSWLIVLSGAIELADIERLDACVAVLRVSMASHGARVTADTLAAVANCLMAGGQAETSATMALSELRDRLGASSAALTIEGADHNPIVRAVSRAGDASASDPARASRLVMSRRVDGGGVVNLALAHWGGRPFSPQEHQVAAAVAAAFERWSQGLAAWHDSGRERRRSSARFEQEVENFAGQALSRGDAATTIVVRAPAARDIPGLVHRWVASIRGYMRASDIVGVLSDGEVAVLLHDAGPEHAARAAGRVTAVVAATPEAGAVTVGMATRQPGEPAAGIVQEARFRADGRGSAPEPTPVVTGARSSRAAGTAVFREVGR
jgi:hypothetical protein